MSAVHFSGPVISAAGFTGQLNAGLEGTETVTATNIILPAESGTTYFMSALAGFVTTLPTPAAGLAFTFIVATAPTSNGYVINTATGNIMYGTHSVTATGGGSAIAGAHVVTLVANSSVIGDRIEIVSDGTSWFLEASSTLKASITSA